MAIAIASVPVLKGAASERFEQQMKQSESRRGSVDQRKVSIPTSADGLRLAAIVEAPEKPKAVVQFVHGMCEHKERYVPFMEYLASMGYACVIHDNICRRYNTLKLIIMSKEEKKERMARNYAINSKKTPRTRRMAFARAHAGGIIITDPKLKERLTTYAD